MCFQRYSGKAVPSFTYFPLIDGQIDFANLPPQCHFKSRENEDYDKMPLQKVPHQIYQKKHLTKYI